jgi:hypothetical protein
MPRLVEEGNVIINAITTLFIYKNTRVKYNDFKYIYVQS